MRPSHRTLVTLLAALALLAAPVAARTLGGGGGDGEPARTTDAGRAPAAQRSTDRAEPGETPAAARRTGGVPLAVPPLTPSARADAQAAAARQATLRTARAVGASRREGVAVLVDKRSGLWARHRPRDLVVPRVAFLAGIPPDARLMRRRAARALERLFAAARRDRTALAAVSGFRSFASQRALFRRYASERGVRRAGHVSARAGHSEHQTGLVMDVSGADGRCAASACFAGTRAARWLARHAFRHGFVVRYPAHRRAVTGYAHEPWHLRYVGVALAREAHRSGRTLDELLAPARHGER